MRMEQNQSTVRWPAVLAAHNETVAVAESCTGGLLAARWTDTAGASAYFIGGAVTYSDAAKQRVLGVSAEMLARYSAVSEQVARAMVEGVLRLYGATWGMATTGFAGPGGGTAEDPVGTVYIATGRAGRIEVNRYVFAGGRTEVRRQATDAAWEQLRRQWMSQGGQA